MSFDTYTALQASVRSFLWDRSDVVSQIPDFIRLAEAEMKRLLNTRQTIQRQPYTVANEIASIPCQAQEIISVKLQIPGSDYTDLDLDYMGPEAFEAYVTMAPQRPRIYTIIGDLVYLYPVPDQQYTGTITFREGFCPLSAQRSCNWVLKHHPDIYLAGALKWAKRWLIDQDMDWDSVFYSGIEQANADMPRVQRNTKLRNDDLTAMGSRRRGFNVYTGGY